MKRCVRCIMPETVPGISFDKEGVCSFCLNYQEPRYLKKDDLEEIIASAKKKQSEFDCIVPLSGGRDSTFVLYMAKAVYNLNVLAVSNDNEFRVDQALINMKASCKMLDVPFISVRSKRDVAQKIVKHNIIRSLPYGMLSIISNICGTCTYGYRSAAYRAADQYKAPLILWGESQAEATGKPEKQVMEKLGGETSTRIQRLFDINSYKIKYYNLLLRNEFPVSGNSIFAMTPPILKSNATKEIRLFDYEPWDRERIKDVIMNELGWEKPHGHVSTWRIDCRLHSFVNFGYFRMMGCSKDCFGYCNMINDGQISREQALKQEEEMVNTSMKGIRELLEDEIGLSKRKVEKIL